MTTLIDMAQYLQTLLKGDAALGLKEVYYGDQDRLAFTPVAAVETGDKARELNGAPRRTMVTLTCYVLVYHSAVKSVEANRLEDDQAAEDIETLIHTDGTMGGIVIHSLVTRVEYGYQMRSNTLYRASRLTVEATVQEQLPSAF